MAGRGGTDWPGRSLVLVLALAGCGGSGGQAIVPMDAGPDVLADAQSEPGADAAPDGSGDARADLPGDTPPETPGDAAHHDLDDAAADAQADMAADAPTDGGDDAAADLPIEASTDLPADPAAELPSDLPSDPLSDLPQDVPTDLPGDPGHEIPSYDPKVVHSLQAILEDYVHFSGDPGIAFAILAVDGRLWSSQAGAADLKTGARVTRESLFRVGSNTKPIVATWILQLVEEGRLDLDAPVSAWFPEYLSWKDITVRQLLGMQGGIPDYIAAIETWVSVLTDPARVYTPTEVLALVKDKPLDFAPGQGCAYTNSNWILLGLIGEKVTGARAADELRKRFFEPLGMESTYLEMAGDPTDRLVHGYMDMAVLVPLMGLPALLEDELDPDLFIEGTRTVDATTLLSPSLTWTAGSIVSRPEDLARFQRALQTGMLVGPDLLEQMHDFHSCSLLGGLVEYGLGTMRYEAPYGPVIGHGGLNFGFHVETFYQPDNGLAFCHMHNFLPAQTVAVTDQAIDVALHGADPQLTACDDSGAALDGDGLDGVRLRFKGPINAADAGPAGRPGMADAYVNLAGATTRLYGFDRLGIYAGARISGADARERVQLTAYGPSTTPGMAMRTLMVYLDPALPAGVGADNTVATSYATALPILVDVAVKQGTFEVARTCVLAVPDVGRAGKAFFCNGMQSRLEAGSMLRMSGTFPLTTDSDVVGTFMKALGQSVCQCADASGTMGECPAP